MSDTILNILSVLTKFSPTSRNNPAVPPPLLWCWWFWWWWFRWWWWGERRWFERWQRRRVSPIVEHPPGNTHGQVRPKMAIIGTIVTMRRMAKKGHHMKWPVTMVRGFTTSEVYSKCKDICRRMLLDPQLMQNSPISSSRDCSLVPLVLPPQLPPTSDYSGNDDDDQVRDQWP